MIHNLTVETYSREQTRFVWDDIAGTLSGEGAQFDYALELFENPPGVMHAPEASLVINNPKHDVEEFMALIVVATGGARIVDVSEGLQGVGAKTHPLPEELQELIDQGLAVV